MVRCKYLYLLFDDSFLAGQNYVFTTEGHPLPIRGSWHEKLPEAYIPANWTSVKVFHASGLFFLLSFLFADLFVYFFFIIFILYCL